MMKPQHNFMIKGTVVIGNKMTIDQLGGNGLFETLAKKFDADWNGIILPSAWYDLFWILNIHNEAALMLKLDHTQLNYRITYEALKRDVKGVYKVFMNMMNPKIMFSLFPSFAKSYMKFMNAKVVQENNYMEITYEKCGIDDKQYLKWLLGFDGGLDCIMETLNLKVEKKEVKILDSDSVKFAYWYSK